ncbi:LemA family protein [Thalassobaculum litoreum]|uniref:LemA protein n=1 Tax=Thalassobaculum litoreum DSM 18839 TaxID=1123362 RepID=A0A8G2BFW8_9PROT|nr:LemA family protein [Thalassobaculum litoreum]SDF43864.1 LemA protein [Thalassobaculum litoreum DSM 18839]
MDMPSLIAVGVFVLLAAYILYRTHSRIVVTGNEAEQALASVDVQLRKRHDLIPQVVATARKFMSHEAALLERLTELRAKAAASYDKTKAGEVAAHLEAERALQSEFRQLFSLAEGYPELKSDESMTRVQDTLEEVEGNIAAARRYYNASVMQHRNVIQTFPGNIIAPQMGAVPLPYFETEENTRGVVDVARHFG